MFMRRPEPAPHIELAKSPRPSAESSAACSKGRTEKSAGQMRHVMFHAMKLRRNSRRIAVKRRRQRFANPGKFRQHFDAFARKGRHPQRIKKFRAQPRVRIARHRHVIDFFQRESRRFSGNSESPPREIPPHTSRD